MKISYVLLLNVLLLIPLFSIAQHLEDRLANWRQQNPVEKLYLHIDRNNYYAGETIWCKGYFMSGFLPSARSSVLNVELLDRHSKVIIKNKLLVLGGMARGQVTLPDTLSTGLYQVKAYSPIMLNQPGFTFTQHIMIYGKNNKDAWDERIKKNARLEFFPEGGSFITGLSNVVAFKVTGADGIPFQGKGKIWNSKDEFICSFESFHDGMGSFTITPIKDENYYAVEEGNHQKYSLPNSTDEGIVLNITDEPGAKRFKIKTVGNDHVFKPAYLIGQMENMVIFRKPLPQDRNEITGIIKTADYYSGILQLTVFNKDNMPLAERITFVDNKEYVLPVSIKADTLDTGARKRNHFTITIPDTVTGNFSISVTDADYESTGSRASNIYSSFLLKSDIRGYIHNPSYYFSTPGDSVKTALELLMMTNGWTRFKWTDVTKNKLPPPIYNDPGFIKLRGKVYIEGTKKPLANKDIIMMITPADSISAGPASRILHTDSLGKFETDSLFLFGKAKIVFSEVSGRNNKFIKVQLDTNSLIYTDYFFADTLQFHSKILPHITKKMEDAYIDYINAKGFVLKNVTVHATQKSPIDKLDEAYSSGYFSGAVHSYKLDIRNENYPGNIFQYLRERIPGLKVSGEPGDYALHYRGGNLTYYMANGEEPDPKNKPDPWVNTGNVTLFLNEIPSNPVALETVSLNDIALIKLFPSSSAAIGGSAVLAVYTKKGEDSFIPTAPTTDIITYNGYTIIKEFYNPDYSPAVENTISDHRITLKWMPDIVVNGANLKVPFIFYNNDRTNRFKIVAEGITSEGKMLMLEKIIGP